MRFLIAIMVFVISTSASAQWAAQQEELDFSRGEFRTIQSHLVAFGYPVSVDGKFGPQTDAAIYRFLQDTRAAGLRSDGYGLIPFMERLRRQGWHRPGGSAAPRQTSASRPSFACSKATLPSEKAICAHADLAALDRKIAAHYKRVLGYVSRSGRTLTRAEQRSWLDRRNQCGSNYACLKNIMRERENDLSYQAR